MDTLKGLGIAIEQSVPHQHQQNGRAERAIRKLSWKKPQCLCFTACLLQSWWEFCVNHAVYLINQNSNCAPRMADAYRVTNKSETRSLWNLCVFSLLVPMCFYWIEVRANKLAPRSELYDIHQIWNRCLRGWCFVWTKWHNFHWSYGYLWTKPYSHAAQELRLQQEQILVKLRIWKVTFLMGMPDGGLMPPGPSSETLSQDDSNDNHSNEGLDYPGDLDDKSPESSPPSTKTSISQHLISSTISEKRLGYHTHPK